MPKLPQLTHADVKAMVPSVEVLPDVPIEGGQKLVFKVSLGGHFYALKFLPTQPPEDIASQDTASVNAEVSGSVGRDRGDAVEARAKREVEIMELCKSPHLVQLGPIPLTRKVHAGNDWLVFSEEWVEGKDLDRILKPKLPLEQREVAKLGRHINAAIQELWKHAKVHRDVKPKNIMRRSADSSFLLLDVGFALDLTGESLSETGSIVGTRMYMSPEQMNYRVKRNLDFRSDLFSLGIVMYEAASGRHPFYDPSHMVSSMDVMGAIQTLNPEPPVTINPKMDPHLSEVIMRLLSKRPHGRFRTCAAVESALAEITQRIGE